MFRQTLCALLATLVMIPSLVSEPSWPQRPADALAGSVFAKRIASLETEAREAAVLAEVRRGNLPPFLCRFVAVNVPGATFWVAPDYLAIGSDDDYVRIPLTPATAQAAADALGCSLPTRKMVDAIYQAAPLKLVPIPIPPDAAMTTMPVFTRHNSLVQEQRDAALATHPLGTLVAGHKKDVVITPRLVTAPGKVAIYGWHQTGGSPIQPLFLGHAATWVDYSHGIRLVRQSMAAEGASTTIALVLADEKRCSLLGDEGPFAMPRYEIRNASLLSSPPETTEELPIETGIRIVLKVPEPLDPGKRVLLVIYALPAGNTIEQTLGRRLKPGDDWRFDIQHIAAQARWLRHQTSEANLVVACAQSDKRSWVLWRQQHSDSAERIVRIIDALRRRFSNPRIALASHSAGGSFILGYIDGVERIPDDIERIAFIDSNYAYEAAKGHDTKLAQWLSASQQHYFCVAAYEDYLALLDGKPFVSEQGGTWGRSQAMLRDLNMKFAFACTDESGLQHHAALNGRAVFLLKENPAKAILHTRLVELNGFIHAMLVGTPHENQGYGFLGARAYDNWISAD